MQAAAEARRSSSLDGKGRASRSYCNLHDACFWQQPFTTTIFQFAQRLNPVCFRLLESRSQNRQVAEEQQDKLCSLQYQRDKAERDFREANVERIRRSKSVMLPTPTTPYDVLPRRWCETLTRVYRYRLMRNIVMKLPFGDELATMEPLSQVVRALHSLGSPS